MTARAPHPWATDGSPGGTFRLAPINPYGPNETAVFGGTENSIVYWADGSAAGYEPWVHQWEQVRDQATVAIVGTVADPASAP